MAKALSLTKKLNWELIFLGLIVVFSLLLRGWHINTDLLFHRDQGLHALGSWSIWHDHQWKLLGHSTDVDGIYHGPLYFYFMSIPYFLSGGNPGLASLFQIVLEVISTPLLYLALKRLFDQRVAALTLVFYSVSYGLIGYSRWLSNVTPIWPLINIFLFQITRIRKNTALNIFIDCLIVGLICQFNGAVGFGLVPFLIWFERKYLKTKYVLLIILGLILPAIPLLIFELRHQFVTTHAIISFIFQDKQGAGISITPLINNIRTYLLEVNHIIVFPFTAISSLLLIIGFIRVSTNPQRKLIYLFIFLPILVLAVFKRGAIGFFLVPILPLSLAIVVLGIESLGKLKLIIFALLVAANLYFLPQTLFPSNALVPIGSNNLITLQDRLNIIDWTYKQAKNQPFAIWTYNIPYFQDEPWIYLFNWYGQKTYGYIPEKMGGFSPNDLKQAKLFFDYYEPDINQPYRLDSWLNEADINFGQVLAEYQSHDVHAQLRAWPVATASK